MTTELSGTLDGVGLPPIVRFLGGLRKTGTLRLRHHDWYGELIFVDGRVTGASLGGQTGLAALDAIVEALPGADFNFNSQAVDTGEPSIRLAQEALNNHLDDITRRLEAGLRKFPAIDAVPSLVVQDENAENGDEPLPLDRGTLQTLLGVDGRRSVREIVADRGTLDALWQLASLLDVGLIRLSEAGAPSVPSVSEAVVNPEPAANVYSPATEPLPQPAPQAFAPPRSAAEESPLEGAARCPKLGFQDDPASSYSKPTRLHRCFATGTSMPVSLEQQRGLCLSSQFGTCPRLKEARPAETSENRARIVRLPVVNRTPAAEREAVASSGAMNEPTRLRGSNGTAHGVPAGQRTPLRARQEYAAPVGAAVGGGPVAKPPVAPEPVASAPVSAGAEMAGRPPAAEARLAAKFDGTEPGQRRWPRVRVAIAGAVVALVVIATVSYLLLPQLDSLVADDSTDTTSLPNTSRVVAGTSVSAIARKTNPTAVAPPAAQPQAATAAQPQAAPAAQPQAAPAAQPQAAPAARPTQAPPQATAVAAPTAATVLAEHFKNNDAGWPSSPLGPATVMNGSYRIATRLAGQFVALGAPVANPPADVTVSAGFRKVDGPAGGGYGIILRDQGPGPRDGASQEGRYYVLEIGDKGEIGIWRRDSDHWVDLLSWQHSEVVKPGTAPNELTVKAVGSTLTMTVNGTEVATRTDSTLSGGQVGVFVGGDGNQVLVDHFLVQTP